MKRLEIRSFDAVSLFKATLYILLLPLLFVALIGGLLAVVGGVTGHRELLLAGLAYAVMPVFLFGACGVLNVLVGLVYNGLAGKFGGLVITVREGESAPEAMRDADKPANPLEPPVRSKERFEE